MSAPQTPPTPRDDFTRSFDAGVWARAFLDTVREHPDVPTDEGTMLGWFASALMRGYDEHAWKVRRESAALAASAGPLSADIDKMESDAGFDGDWETAFLKMRTAYTALAAHNAELVAQNIDAGKAVAVYVRDLAALRATVAEWKRAFQALGTHLITTPTSDDGWQRWNDQFGPLHDAIDAAEEALRRAPTPEGQG